MSDQIIAAIARRVAVNAAINGYERRDNSKIEYLQALTELCAAVKAEQDEQLPRQ
jgi:hypothetical protein